MKRINPRLIELARKTCNPDLKTDSSILEQKQQETYAPELEGYIYVPSINLYVAKERTMLGKEFYETQKELRKNNNKMLTPYEFFEFIKYLKKDYQDKNEASKILDEILTIRDPWRSEWLDHDYKKESTGLYVLYHKYNNGKIEQVREPLDKNTLMKNKEPGIDLESLLNNKTSQGLPKSNIKEGSLYYRWPGDDDDSIARFYADSDGALLNCNGNPRFSHSSLGVRLTRFP